MQNNSNIQTAATVSSSPLTTGTGNVPETTAHFPLWADSKGSVYDPLAPFDYEGFLRREGLS